MDELKKTPLYQQHVAAGGKIVDFGGWALPVQYSGILEEIAAVRKQAGLFDVSHMGEIMVSGPKSLDWLQFMLTNDVSKLEDGQVLYTFMCYPEGGVVDDLLVYRYNADKYLLVVNAGNAEKDWQWLNQHVRDGVELENISPEMAQLALQGPLAQQVLQKLCKEDLDDIGFFRFRDQLDLGGVSALVSRTGYTGEDGFEIYCRPDDAPPLWDAILTAGKDQVLPCGLGSRDTLRFEANLPLYGQEISRDISPLEARLGFFVKLKKGDFIGREALAQQKEEGLKRRLVGLTMVERGVPRTDYPVYDEDDNQVGHVTTGSYSPTLEENIANALVDTQYTQEGAKLWVGVRKRRLEAKVTKLPFYKREGK